MEKGQEIVVVTTGNRARYSGSKATIETISSVGRKYFELTGLSGVKFLISDLSEVTNYSTNYIIYKSMEDYEDKMERDAIIYEVRGIFKSYGNIDLTLTQLKSIRDIINQPITKQT